MKKSAIYIIYKWLWNEVDSGVDYYLSAGGQGVDTSMDHVVQHEVCYPLPFFYLHLVTAAPGPEGRL